jgi:hypothetical protein
VHFVHEIFIYGYDMTESTFYVADNLRNGKYIHAKCKISDIETAYWDADVQNEYRKQVFLLRKRDVTSYNFDIVQVKQLLEAYLYSQPIPLIYHQGNSLYGFKAMKNLLSTLKQEYSYGEITYLDQRAFHLLKEEKLISELLGEIYARCKFDNF